MRILYHHRTLGDGAEGIHVREMVRAFRAEGHQVKVIGPAGERPPEKSKSFRILDRLKKMIPAAIYELLEIGYSAYAFYLIRREMRVFKPDLIYDRYITFNAGTILAARKRGIPVYLEVNAPLALERSGEKDERLVFRKTAARMESWICSNANRTIVVSTPLKDYLESIGVPPYRCVVMPNGVDPVKFAPRQKQAALLQKLGVRESSFVVGFTGVLRAWHGIDLLLTAMSGLIKSGADACLVIVGDGPYRVTIEEIAAKLGLSDAVFITGRVAHEQVADLVSLFDVAVSPRATFYASPMKVVEYMALGKAVVVPGTQNFLDMVDEGVNGVTFRDGDAADLERVLGSLCNHRSRCVELGLGARQKVEYRLNWRWNAVEVCRLFSEERVTATTAVSASSVVTER